jgi:L-seryl-tRNA(Ser) seleniumtransferase
MIATGMSELTARAETVRRSLPTPIRSRVAVEPMLATVGGGSLPGETLHSAGLVIRGRGAAALAGRHRTADPAVVARVEDGAVWLEHRTVDPGDDVRRGDALAAALARA